MSIHVKLGENASMFYDPTTQVKVMPNAAVEVSNKQKASKKFKRALNAGHLTMLSKEEAKKFNSVKTSKEPETKEVTESDITKMKKSALVAYAVENEYGTEEEMDGMNKADLLEYIQSEEADGDDHDDDEDDEDDEEE